MAVPGAEYWARRAAARMDKYLRDSDQTLSIIAQAHKQAQRDIQDAIDRIYARMEKKYGLTPLEIQAYLDKPAGREEYLQLLREIPGVKDPALRRQLEARASSGAYSYRVSRLDALKDHVQAQTGHLASVEAEALEERFKDLVPDAYSRSIYDIQRGTGYGFSFAQMDTQAVSEILHNPWSGSTFSARIWKAQDVLAQELNTRLTAGFMSGRSNAQMARELADTMGVSYSNAERLVRTETNYMANAAEMQSYKEIDITQYEYMATLDMRTSQICQELDGQVFEVKDARPGKNMPPMHPHCRSTTVAHFDDESLEGLQRRAKDPVTGQDVMVPRDMKYKDWLKLQEDTYGPERMATARKMVQNEAKDREQFGRYVDVLGKKNLPATFAKFQELKYTDSGTWNEVTSLYRDVSWQKKAQENAAVISTHKIPNTGSPNSVVDNALDGKILSRRYFGKTGKPRLDIDLTNHGNAKVHSAPHAHSWAEVDGEGYPTRQDSTGRPPTKAEEIANADILKGGRKGP